MNSRALPCFLLVSLLAAAVPASAAESTTAAASAAAARKHNTIVLDAVGVQNLRIATAVVEPGDFEEAVFALGRVEAKPGNVASVSSRISGRIIGVSALPGDLVEAGAEVLKVESRQPGNPAPVIPLATPLRGTVTKLEARLGDPVEPDRALMEITDLTELFAIARVPEHVAGRMQPGTEAHLRLAALGERRLTARLLRFGTAADEASGTIDAIFALPNPEGVIRPGMRAEFSIVLAKRTDVMSVPRSALQGDAASRHVYVKDFDLKNAFVKTPVVVGQSNDRFVEIVSGLLPSDEVVVQGGYSLAFVGGGTLSLKEALDAAHGHEHNADGSEMTSEQRRQSAEAKARAAGGAGAAAIAATGHGHEHEHGHGHGGGSPFWMIVSGVLFALLVVVSLRKRAPAPGATSTPAGTRKGD